MKEMININPNDLRLWHKDYDDNLSGIKLRNQQTKAKKELVDEFVSNYGIIKKSVKKFSMKDNQGNAWYYSTTHAKGTTMIMFAKFPIGIDCQANDSVPTDYLDLVKYHFNKSEKQWLAKHNDPLFFLELWVSKEAFYKCYFMTYNKAPDFNKWKLKTIRGNLAYTNGKQIYGCEKGIGGNKYTFTICFKK